jgi:hypothetical protein
MQPHLQRSVPLGMARLLPSMKTFDSAGPRGGLALALVAAVLALAALPAPGAAAGKAPDAAASSAAAPKVDFESGGVSADQIEAMRGRLHFYNLRLVTAAAHSGAYLADVEVTIRSLPQRTTVIQTRMQGPWLLAWLPPGRYELEARYDQVAAGAPKVHKRTTVVPRKGRRDLIMYFKTGDEVSPDDAPASASSARKP